jgi:hypothetical protein
MMAFKKDARLNGFGPSQWAWQDAVYGGMIVASLLGLIYTFTRK